MLSSHHCGAVGLHASSTVSTCEAAAPPVRKHTHWHLFGSLFFFFGVFVYVPPQKCYLCPKELTEFIKCVSGQHPASQS